MSAATTAANRLKVRRIVWTVGIAAITAVGSIYGAGLKIRQEASTERQKIREASPEEKIAMLEERRQRLLTQRRPFQRKLEEVEGRIKAREETSAAKTDGK